MMPNPDLQPLQRLVGEWNTIGVHPMVPGIELRGKVVFEWILGGAYLQMVTTIDHTDFPDGLAIFGSDDERSEIYVLYFDERGVSRRQDFHIEGDKWSWQRIDAALEMSQRFTVAIEPDGNTMVGKGELRKKSGDWEGDLDLTYHRVP